MILWHKCVVLGGGGTLEIILRGEIDDPVEFWNGREGQLIITLNRMVREFEAVSLRRSVAKQNTVELAGTDNSASPDMEKEKGGAK